MTYNAVWMGHRVSLPLQPASLRVAGVTSRGIFLFSPQEKVVFLSYERHRGPLSINIQTETIQTQPGEFPHLENHCLSFPGGDSVDLRQAVGWAPPPPPTALADHPARRAILRAVAEQVPANKRQTGLIPLFGPLLGLPFPPLAAELTSTLGCINAIRAGANLLPVFEKILGLGRGLTPSGDDFTVGYFLARSRVYSPGLDELACHTLAAANQCTTTLSAALIESAIYGSADERLVRACDALLDGGLDAVQIHTLLADYGASSGLDAFTGMATFLG